MTLCISDYTPIKHLVYSHRYADHRVLHSFPTRRSSDLSSGPGGAIGSCQDTDAGRGQQPAGRRSVPLAAAGLAVDRKSTRLNSSHTVISYAVFCLKKKRK